VIPLRCFGQKRRSDLFLFSGSDLSINTVFLKTFRLSLQFFKVSLALDAEAGKRHCFKAANGNFLLAIFADSVFTLI
jgi:hypothetical protein